MTTAPPACTYPGCPDPHITRSGVMGCLLDGGDSDQPLVFASGTHLHVHDAEISRPSTRPRSERWSFTEGEATSTLPPEGTTEPRCPECRCPYGPGSHWSCLHRGCDCHVEWESAR